MFRIGSAADKAGRKPGDVVIEINGKSLSDCDLYDADEMLIGTEPKVITLKFRRELVEKAVTLQLQRDH